MDSLLPEMIEPVEEKQKQVAHQEADLGSATSAVMDNHINMIERERVDADEVFQKESISHLEAKKGENPIVLKVESGDSIEEPELTDIDALEELIQPPPKIKKKRVVTEAQKAHLAKAREKALETRRRNKAVRDAEKNADMSLKEKKMLAKKKIRDEETKKLDNYINDRPAQPSNTTTTSFQFTQDDLDEAVSNGIQKYETIRKARKVEKVKAKETEKKKEQIYNVVSKAVNRGIYDHCF